MGSTHNRVLHRGTGEEQTDRTRHTDTTMRLKMNAKELYSVLNSADKYNSEGLFNLTSRGMLCRVHDASNTALYAMFIPEDAADEWEAGQFPKIGLEFDNLLDFLPNKDQPVVLEVKEVEGRLYKMIMHSGNREVRIPLLDPDTVEGAPDQIPDLDHPVHIKNEFGFFADFISDFKKMGSSSSSGAYCTSARDGMFYLWGKNDDQELIERIHWEDFDEYEIDWDKASPSEVGQSNPSEDHAIDAFMSADFTADISIGGDETHIYLGNHYPMKVVSHFESGVRQSWTIPPRIPAEDERATLPERVITDRSLVS